MKTDSTLSKKILQWYKLNGRKLPWRTTFTPYGVWLSEIMLQQTQVETVIPYFNRFLETFPTIDALAQASLDQVLKQWEGLGYYSRARNLHYAARIIIEKLDGKIPDKFETLIKLPGIGRSTAGAILSLAYNIPFPILDGNVRRVLARYFAVQIPPGKQFEEDLWSYSASLVPEKEARSFNSALMDLGATVCRPKGPLCEICPLRSSCLGLKKNLQNELPLKKRREKIPLRTHFGWVIWKKDRVLIRRREEKGLLGGLWEFPCEKLDPVLVKPGEKGLEEHSQLGLKLIAQEFLFKLHHTFTHFKMELYVFKAKYRSGMGKPNDAQRWVTLDEIEEFPFSATDKKIIRALKTPNPCP